MEELLNDKTTAKMIKMSVQTLRNWRHMRKGPTYLKIGRSVRYRQEDLEKFLKNNRIKIE